jgi:hypothetical protein
MAVKQSFHFEGGPHDGERIEPPSAPPDTLFGISFRDGSDYARAGQQIRDDAGAVREVFRFDCDGSLTEQAKKRFAPLLG